MNIFFKPMQQEHLALWQRWIEKPHVKDVWFIAGYQTADAIYQKLDGNGYDYPFIIYDDKHPIGFIQCCDLYAYRTQCSSPKGLFPHEEEGTFCVDLFIGEEEYLDQGYGTVIVKSFITYMVANFHVKRILIDPAITNKRAIRCYEKAGFQFVRQAHDGVTLCYIMAINTPNLVLRPAIVNDLSVMVALLADDELGKIREIFTDLIPESYKRAFDKISNSPTTELLVVELEGHGIIGMAQVDFITYLTYQGGTRAEIEGVRVHKDYRNYGIGRWMIMKIIEKAKQRNCHMVQLTTNKVRLNALRFYKKLGFNNTHEGLKLILA